MMKMRAAIPLLFTVSSSCVIIVEPNTPPPGPVLPGPLSCVMNADAPTAHIFYSMRLERSTVNVAESYGEIMITAAAGLTAAGILPTHAVLLRADERPVENNGVLAAWGCDLDDPKELLPQSVIEHYAQRNLSPAPVGCVTDPLVEAGRSLTDLTTSYPADLPGRSGRSIFGRAPSFALVIHFDERARRSALGDAACGKALELTAEDGDRSSWLRYADGGPVAEHVIHWFFTTEEGVDRNSFVSACREYEGFPTEALDVIEPSANAVYGPLSTALKDGSSRVSTLSWCAAMSPNEFSSFIEKEMKEIASIAGTEFNEELFGQLLSGDLPMTEMPTDGTSGPGR